MGDPVDATRVVFDLTDALSYYREYVSVSGIQRVVERLTASPRLQEDRNVVFVVRAKSTNSFFQLDKTLLTALARPQERSAAVANLNAIANYLDEHRLHLRLKKYPWKRVRRKYRDLHARAVVASGLAHLAPFEFEFDDSVVLSGAYWIDEGAVQTYSELRHKLKLRICVFVYDLIPLTHPWCVDLTGTKRFRDALDQVIRNCDQLIVISKHVAGELARYVSAQGAEQKPTLTLPFGWDFPEHQIDADVEAMTLARYGVEQHGFILVVSTIELRKNQLLVARAAYNLYPRLKGRIPPILFVGKFGFGFKFIAQELSAVGYLDGRIRILPDVSDAELACLYSACRFTVFPSFVEGWGLPVQESLAFKKPCLASCATSIPEAGLDLATYFDPHDLAEFEERFARWLEAPEVLAAAQARVSAYVSTHELPRWDDSASAVIDFARGGRMVERPSVVMDDVQAIPLRGRS